MVPPTSSKLVSCLSTTAWISLPATSVRPLASIDRWVLFVVVPKLSSSLTAAMSSSDNCSVTTLLAVTVSRISASDKITTFPPPSTVEWSVKRVKLKLSSKTGSLKVSNSWSFKRFRLYDTSCGAVESSVKLLTGRALN